METTMSKWTGLTTLVTVVAMMSFGCAQGPSAARATVEDKTYPVTPASVTVKTGILTGEVTELKGTERVEKGSDRVVSAAKVTVTLRLKNTSANQSVRLVRAMIWYTEANGGSFNQL